VNVSADKPTDATGKAMTKEEFLAWLPTALERAMPKPKPKPKLASETELPLVVQRKRFAQAQRRLMEEEKAQLAAEHNRRVFGEMRAESHRLSPADIAQASVDFWVDQRRKAEAHERWFRRQLDPTNSGIYEVAPCHRDKW
jgi:hypothetical protein